MKIDMNKDYVITINREVGSGGRTVGRMLAQRLGVPFYDKALINALTEMYHLSVEEIEELKDGEPLALTPVVFSVAAAVTRPPTPSFAVRASASTSSRSWPGWSGSPTTCTW